MTACSLTFAAELNHSYRFTLSLWMSIQSLPFIKLLTKRSTPLYVWGAPWILPVKATAVFLLSVGLSGRALLKLDHLLRVAFKESVIDSKDHVVVQMRAAISTCVLSGALAFTSGTIFAVVFAIQLRLHRDQEKRCSSTIWGRPSLPSPTPPNNQPSLSVPPENVSPEPSPISSNSSLTLNDPQSNELPHERSNDSEERGKSKILRMIQLNEFNGTLLAVSAMIAFCAFQLATAVVPWNLKVGFSTHFLKPALFTDDGRSLYGSSRSSAY